MQKGKQINFMAPAMTQRRLESIQKTTGFTVTSIIILAVETYYEKLTEEEKS